MKAMIVAAGLGTRLKPLTDTLPKALVQVGDAPLLEHVIRRLIAVGCDEIIINIHHFPEQIIRFVEEKDHFGIRIHFSDERDALLETGGGIRKARELLDDGEPFLVHNVDIISNLDIASLYAQHLRTNPLATLVVSERDTFRYLLFNDDNRLMGWTNLKTGEVKPTGLRHADKYKKLAFSGIQVLSPKVFDLMDSWPERFSIMDFYLSLAASQTLLGYIPENYSMIDVGKPETLSLAREWLARH